MQGQVFNSAETGVAGELTKNIRVRFKGMASRTWIERGEMQRVPSDVRPNIDEYSARRHQDEGVVSRDQMLDDLPLPPAEGVIAVNGLQNGEWICRHGKHQILEEGLFQ